LGVADGTTTSDGARGAAEYTTRRIPNVACDENARPVNDANGICKRVLASLRTQCRTVATNDGKPPVDTSSRARRLSAAVEELALAVEWLLVLLDEVRVRGAELEVEEVATFEAAGVDVRALVRRDRMWRFCCSMNVSIETGKLEE